MEGGNDSCDRLNTGPTPHQHWTNTIPTPDQHWTNIRPTLGQHWTVTIRKCDTNQIDSYNHDTDTSNFLTFRSTEHVRDHVEMSWRRSHQVATDRQRITDERCRTVRFLLETRREERNGLKRYITLKKPLSDCNDGIIKSRR